MAKFKVGDRVLLVRPCMPENYGKTGVIREIFAELLAEGGVVNCYCDFDDGTRGGIDLLPDGKIRATHTDQLEPILRPDNEVGDWAELGFHPSKFQRVAS